MLKFFFKLNNLFLSKNYRYFDIFLAVLGFCYCLYYFFIHNEIKQVVLFLSIFGLILGTFDLTRKFNTYIQKKMLGLKH